MTGLAPRKAKSRRRAKIAAAAVGVGSGAGGAAALRLDRPFSIGFRTHPNYSKPMATIAGMETGAYAGIRTTQVAKMFSKAPKLGEPILRQVPRAMEAGERIGRGAFHVGHAVAKAGRALRLMKKL